MFSKKTFATVALLAACTAPAFAATTNADINVNATLTPVCLISNITAASISYESFQSSVATSSNGGFNVKCTSGQSYTIAMDTTSGTVAGLNYSIGLGKTSPTSTSSGTGNGADQTVAVTASMVAGQSGTTGGGTVNATVKHTVTVTY